MSSYLQRFIQRSSLAHEQAAPQPFVRSTSPIAESDQRLGMAGLQGTEFGVVSLTPISSDIGVESPNPEGQPPFPSQIIETDHLGEERIQRKQADLSPGITPTMPTKPEPASDIAPPVSTNRNLGHLDLEPFPQALGTVQLPPSSETHQLPQPVGLEAEQLDRLAPSPTLASFSIQAQSTNLESPKTSGALEYSQPSVSMPPASPSFLPDIATSRDMIPTQSRAIAFETLKGTTDLTSSSEQAESLVDISPVVPQVVEDSQMRADKKSSHPDEPPPLTPAPRPRPDLEGLMTTALDAATDSQTVHRPQVVIGRINVEVVPPPPASQTDVQSFSGPVTAESASVIGPLGGGIRPYVRYSLRQR